jgi:hypothetical protein
MKHLRLSACFIAISLSSCATHIGKFPQNSDEFVSMYGKGGMFNKVEEVVVSQPYSAVVKNIQEYSSKCINNYRRSTKADYATRQSATITDFQSSVSSSNGETTFSIQEQYEEQQVKNLPVGGMYILVAKIRKGGSGTNIGLYHLARGNMAHFTKEWANGNKKECPQLGK